MFNEIFNNIKEKSPLIHCITNYVTVNDCANALLALGASPIMADAEGEVEDIISICNALCINIGTLNERTIQSMIKAGKKANDLNKPVILDPVGAGASKLRTETAFQLLKEVKFSVIRGNISEIKTVAQGSGSTKGVDADVSDRITEENLGEAVLFAKELSWKTGSVIVITGAIDIAAGAEKAYVIRNGHPLMSGVTGTGCMLSAMVAAFCGANTSMTEAAALAVCIMGLCGEKAYDRIGKTGGGTGTYRTCLIDEISKMDRLPEGGMKIEMQ